jgi:hypothetical protein
VSETTTASKKQKARSQTTWPTYIMNAGEVNEDGQPLNQRTLTRLSTVCGLALEKFEDLTEDEKNELKEKGEEGSYEGHVSFIEGLQKHTCDVSEKKAEPLREVQ